MGPQFQLAGWTVIYIFSILHNATHTLIKTGTTTSNIWEPCIHKNCRDMVKGSAMGEDFWNLETSQRMGKGVWSLETNRLKSA